MAHSDLMSWTKSQFKVPFDMDDNFKCIHDLMGTR